MKFYSDYGPTLLVEKIAKPPHMIYVSCSTARRWLIGAGRWDVRRRHLEKHPWRERRPRFGGLIQLDASIHDWFGGRGKKAVLVAEIDDASGRAWGRFASGDTVHANFEVIRGWVERYGRPGAFYVDRHTYFSIADEDGVQRHDSTQIGRALVELDIEMISAHSPQAKGRIERVFRTLQDRLVKELRERKVRTIDEANAVLGESYWDEFNQTFGRPPRDPHDAHRPLLGEHRRRLSEIFSVREERKVATNLTIQFQGRRFLVATDSHLGLHVGHKVEVAVGAQGQIRVLFKGRDVAFHEVELDRRQKPRQRRVPLGLKAVTSKPAWKPAADHPWRKVWKPERGSTRSRVG